MESRNIDSLEELGISNFIIAFSSIGKSIFISKESIGGLKELGISDFFIAFSNRGRSIFIAKRGLDSLEGPDIDPLP
jgi:hypothetical protein